MLACAALCDERLAAVASLAAVAPYDADGLDFLEGMGEENHIEFGKVLEGETALRPYLEHETEAMLAASPDELVAVMATLLGDEDRAVLTGAFAEFMLEWTRTVSSPASTAGSTTTSPSSSRGASTSARSTGRRSSCTERTTVSCRCRTGGGSPRGSLASRRGSAPATAT